jgi:nitrate reductase molybdenum cofactor assembly chaperone NarJ/NarW
MEKLAENTCLLLAEAFCYPEPGHLARLESGLAGLPEGAEKKGLGSFIGKVRGLSLGEWEEEHTRTLDLNPPAAPYIGFQTWGESYQRGVFLAQLNRAMFEAGIDLEGELPDHLIPVLRYLGTVENPLPELLPVIAPAVKRMLGVLRGASPDNPYVDLLEAVFELCKGLAKEEA